jgi:hypothetical protein
VPSARDAVARDTPAAAATSESVGRDVPDLGRSTIAPLYSLTIDFTER